MFIACRSPEGTREPVGEGYSLVVRVAYLISPRVPVSQVDVRIFFGSQKCPSVSYTSDAKAIRTIKPPPPKGDRLPLALSCGSDENQKAAPQVCG